MTYQQFLESKMVIAPESGFDVDPDDINWALKHPFELPETK